MSTNFKSTDYKAPKPSAFTKFLWWCCGADKQLLERSTYADYSKFTGLGGVVLATGILAALAMGFAMSRVFEEASIFVFIVIGLLWGGIIFNLDRFIVSSTGKGDGKHTISSEEAWHALPRILMAALIGITISGPLEVYIFQKEIDKQWEVTINEKREEAAKIAESEFLEKSKKNNELVAELKKTIESKEMELQRVSSDLVDEQNRNGRGPKTKDWEKREAILKQELNDLRAAKSKLDYFTIQKDSLIRVEQDLAEYKARGWTATEIEDVMSGKIKKETLPNKLGLLDSLRALHEYPGSAWPAWLVRLLFIFIEIAPVFFKLMIAYSPYDYLSENTNKKLIAAHGIEIKEGFTRLEDGTVEDKVIYHEAEKGLKQRIQKINTDDELYDKVIQKFKDIESGNIESNPDDYIKRES